MREKPMIIADKIGLEATLGQLAEEAAELAQAALKMQRILMGKNPTPVTLEKAKERLIEEGTDVHVCCSALWSVGVDTFDEELFKKKLERWKNRIEEAKND